MALDVARFPVAHELSADCWCEPVVVQVPAVATDPDARLSAPEEADWLDEGGEA